MEIDDIYPFYESFIGYLANHYSLEKVIKTLENFSEIHLIFGKSFEMLEDEWIKYLYN